MQTDVASSVADIRHRIAAAAQSVGRVANDITLVAVSKTHPVEAVVEAIALGLDVFGENRVQEADAKIASLGAGTARWHLIGHLQTNKARRAVDLFDVIQSVDSIELAMRLERLCDETGRDSLSILVQIDLAGESSKSGLAENDVTEMTGFLATCKHLSFDGLMLLPPYDENPEASRPYFRRLREIRDQIDFRGGRGELSMGMSHDFETAIEEGATMVRIGTALFGKRG